MYLSKPSMKNMYPLPGTAPRYAPSKLFVIGEYDSKGKIKASESYSEAFPIPYNSKIGSLRVGEAASASSCRITCDCGYSGVRVNSAVLGLLSRGLGCMTPSCTLYIFEKLLWVDVEESLKFQLFILTKLFSEDVVSHWGGRLDDSEELEFEQGYENFSESQLSIILPEEICWIERDCTALPFMNGNIVLASAPSDLLKDIKDRPVDIGGGEMTLAEIMRFTGKSEPQVLKKAFEMKTFADIIHELF